MAACLALLGALLAPAIPAGAAHFSNTIEVAGGTNTAAAAGWSRLAFPATTAEVLLGRDDVFADSLASGSMQGSRPLLLTAPNSLSSDADSELNRLRPSVVNILGGTSAVSTAIENNLKSRGYTVRRFFGPTRIETAIDVARRTAPNATTALMAAAFAPQGGDETRAFADSIAAGGWAAAAGYPVLLTQTETLTTSTRNYLRTALIKNVIIVGGTSAVSEATAQEIQQLGIVVRRVSGPTRFDTATRIAQERGFSDATDATEVILTEGQATFAWAPGFAAAAYAKAKNAPIVLSNGATMPAATNTFLTAGAAAATKLACAPRVQTAACDAATQRMGHTPITGEMPKLQSAALGTSNDSAQEVVLTFSDPLNGNPVTARVKCYTYAGAVVAAGSAALLPDAPTKLSATFPRPSADQCTTVAVAYDAVKSVEGVANPEGSTGLRSYTRPGRTNTEPMLVGGGVVAVDTEDADTIPDAWDATYVFDKAVGNLGLPQQFHVYSDDPVAGVGLHDGDTIQSREGTTVRVRFTGVALPEGNAERLAVEALTASDAAPASVHQIGSNLSGPDLDAISVDTANNRVVYDFDQTVTTVGTATGYHVYFEDGSSAAGTTATLNSSDFTKIDVTFPALTTRKIIVGGWVDTGSASGAGGANGLDEVGVSRTFNAGLTNAPVLDRVIKGSAPGGGTRITFRWGELVEERPGGFFVYGDRGDRTQLPADQCGAVERDIICDIPTSSSIHAAVSESTLAGVGYDAVQPAAQTGVTSADIPNHETSKTYSTS